MVEHAVVMVRTAELSPNQHRIRVALVGYETARQAVGGRIILHAPRDDVYAGYFATALLTKVERGERGLFVPFPERNSVLTQSSSHVCGRTSSGNRARQPKG